MKTTMGQQLGRWSQARLVAGALLTAALASCATGVPFGRVAAVEAPIAPPTAALPEGTESSLAGVVQGPDGVPIEGALVAAIPAGSFEGDGERRAPPTHGKSEPAGLARSSEGGRFQIDHLKPGRYGITATAPGKTGAYLDVVTVHRGKTLEALTLKLAGDGFTVRGVVLGEDGRPVPGTSILASRLSDFAGDCFIVECDERGQYSVTLPTADYSIMATAKGAGTVSQPVKVVGARDRAIDLQLERIFSPDRPAPDEVAAWLKQSAISLSMPEAGHGFADMQPLRDFVGSARVVSLGEAARGAREFFQLKHRVLEFLVIEMGFSVLGIEANFSESLAVNDYVLTGKGDVANALAGLRSWSCDTEEMLDVVRWVRAYNADPKHVKKVKFYGFDMQFAPAAAQALLRYVSKVDRGFLSEAEGILSPLDNDFDDAHYAQRSPELIRSTEAGLGALVERLEENREAYEKRSSAGAWKVARMQADVVRQAAQYHVRPWSSGVRDRAMAANVKALLDLEGSDARMMVWAHNANVSMGEATVGVRSMGSWLHETLGPEQVVFGLAFNQGSFQAVELPLDSNGGLQSFTVGPPPVGSLDGTLARSGQPLLAVDLRKAAAGSPAAEWLSTRLQSRSIGSGYRADQEPSFFLSASPAKFYDALLFVDKVSAAHPTATGRSAGSAQGRQAPVATPANLGFEEGSPGSPLVGWQGALERVKGGYRVEVIGESPREGKRCAVVRRDAAPWSWGTGSLTQSFNAEKFRGKRVRMRAASRAKVSGIGNEAKLFLSAASASKRGNPPLFVTTAEHPITENGWQYYEVDGYVPPDADVITMGLVLAGNGRAYLDDVSFGVVSGAP